MADEAADQATRDQCYQELMEQETEKRLWLALAIKWVQARYPAVTAGEKPLPLEPARDVSDRVRFALDMADVAVADRVARLMRSDLPRG